MKLKYSDKRWAVLKWTLLMLVLVAAIATPVSILEVLNGDGPVWDIAIGPLGILLFSGLFFYQRHLHQQKGPMLEISPEGIMIREIRQSPIPWAAIKSVYPSQIRIFLVLRDGEIEKLGLSEVNLRSRKLGPLKDNSLSFSTLLFSVSEQDILDEIRKYAQAACGDEIELNF